MKLSALTNVDQFSQCLEDLANRHQLSDLPAKVFLYTMALHSHTATASQNYGDSIRGNLEIQYLYLCFLTMCSFTSLYGILEHFIRLFHINGFYFIPGVRHYVPAAIYGFFAIFAAMETRKTFDSAFSNAGKFPKTCKFCLKLWEFSLVLAGIHFAWWFAFYCLVEDDLALAGTYISTTNGYTPAECLLAQELSGQDRACYSLEWWTSILLHK